MIEQIRINIFDFMHITNCYIIWDKETKEAIVVDPADKANLINKKIEELGLKFKYIMLTHAHKDHTIALTSLLEKYKDIKVIANIEEIEMLEAKYNDSSDVFETNQCTYDMNRFMFFDNEEEYKIGNTSIKAIHTPGHTKGCACYYIGKENALITGDTLFDNCFGRCDLDTANIDDMVNSLCKLYKNYKGTYIYPGHGKTKINIEDTYDEVRRRLKNMTHIDLDELLK